MPGVTPEAATAIPSQEQIKLTQADLLAGQLADDCDQCNRGFLLPRLPAPVSFGSGADRRTAARQAVAKEFWITTSRPVKREARPPGIFRDHFAQRGEVRGGYLLRRRPDPRAVCAMATDSAKACYYANAKNKLKTVFLPFDDVVRLALQ